MLFPYLHGCSVTTFIVPVYTEKLGGSGEDVIPFQYLFPLDLLSDVC